MIFKASNILNNTSRKILYYFLFYPHLDYCSEVWGNTYYSNVKSLVVLQKKVVIFYSLNILSFVILSNIKNVRYFMKLLTTGKQFQAKDSQYEFGYMN